MFEFLRKLFDGSDFPARWNCGNWTAGHGWLHIGSDLAIFGAYLAIPCVLVYFMVRRKDLPFTGIFWLFSLFILSCGTVHLIEATIFWHPWYRLSGMGKVVTAAVSWATVIALIPAVPRALALPGLAVANERLEAQLEVQQQTEARLREQSERLRTHAEELESFSAAIVEREDRVIELKNEVDALLSELGRVPRYGMDSHDPA